MNNKLTKKQKQVYLKNPHFCPKCGHTDISVLGWDAEIQSQDVCCENPGCSYVWREIFKMVDIESRY